MSKKNLAVIFLLLSGAIAVLAYAAWNQSNWLTDNQINFSDKLSTNHGNKLTAMVRDSLMNGLTTRAQNHEKRLQAFAQTPWYPNLTSEQTTFTDLLSTRHNNQLTAEMWNGLLNRLTNAVTNHEMRLRALETEKPTPNPQDPNPVIQTTKCQIKPDYSFQCKIWDPTAFGKSVNKRAYSSFLQVKRDQYWNPWSSIMYFGYNRWNSLTFPTWYDQDLNFIDFHSRIPENGILIHESNYDFYARLNDPSTEGISIPRNFDQHDFRAYKKIIMTPHFNEDASIACYRNCNQLECKCRDRISNAKCRWEYDENMKTSRERIKKECENIVNKTSCDKKYYCQWLEI